MSVLILSPHADDAEIGMGATMAFLARTRLRVIHTVLCASDYEGRHGLVRRTTRKEEFEAAGDHLNVESIWNAFPHENRLNMIGLDLISTRIEKMVLDYGVRELYVPLPSANQDHTAIWDAVQVVARRQEPRLIWAYEQPGQVYPRFPEPQLGWEYRNVTERDLEAKQDAMRLHVSQHLEGADGPCSVGGVADLAALRGREARFKYAERFLLVRNSK